jgi:hypothetical protein
VLEILLDCLEVDVADEPQHRERAQNQEAELKRCSPGDFS